MAKTMRAGKVPGGVAAFSLPKAAQTRRAQAALARMSSIAASSPEQAEAAAALLETAADVLDEQRAPTAMPDDEREAWESLGARFDDTDAPARARMRTAARFRGLLEASLAGDAAVAAHLGVNRSRVSQRVGERSLYAFTHGDVRWFPTWQFEGNQALGGLRKVLAALPGDLHPLVVSHWFTAAHRELGIGGSTLSPRDWLATGGDPDRLSRLAVEDLCTIG